MTLNTKRPSQRDTTKEKLVAQVQETAGGSMKRLNAEVDAALYKRIKQRALDEDRTISDITRTLWIEYLNKSSLE